MLPGKHASNGGFSYIGILIAVAILGVSLAATGEIWHTTEQRNREHQLLYVGDLFRQAIGRYANSGNHQYPSNLTDLLRDPRQPGIVRYLRKIYYDPITGTQDWGLVKNDNNQIIGVYSRSTQRPIKQTNFDEVDQDFESKEAYTDWTFTYSPNFRRINSTSNTGTLTPGANTTTPQVNKLGPAPASPSAPSGQKQ